ncbi:rhomboid family intramembrane serine protease [Cytophaga hutchinsonii]|jgi:membrane associated rhomboid family serine protease|uniref:Uncharacterized protein n=1 Tax=Cytophaga hutchinsonii (strain ATCC 33406 / DSM 1761 / CIP 103989 / NBRC 15051 / NCIMB 9469 / D465) TaxID=269798 RepID=A0A6N4SMT4_CYTH3|nr:rhomboid family intramembrane serine protease [Cytophaga hutchinsonii]ABG57578.1 conserved hypothetical protein [Cytophaga hutchinsonii ATCC 33406]SFX00354.1 Membrane associated serine protease, rhomboid family [Cytophaga hutchinsonii ATCC 33406]
MNDAGIISVLLFLINLFFTYRGLKDHSFFDAYKFDVDKILIQKQYKRIISSGFLHIGWTHFILNMYTLYAFSSSLELYVGLLPFLIIYFASLTGGSLFSLFVHRNHGDYTAVGASGAVSGVVFAAIALFPGMQLGFPFIPIHFPAWLFGLVYMLYTIYGVRSSRDNIGHEAHLGGAVIGMLTALFFQPAAFTENTFTIFIIALPTVIFIAFVLLKPQALLIDNLFFKSHDTHDSIDHRYNKQKAIRQKEIDAILDKISRKGINSLSEKEKQKLDDLSQR